MTYVVKGLPRVYAQEETGTEQHAPAKEEEHHNPILPETDELVFGSLAFLLVFLALWRFAFPAISRGLEQRSQKIQGDLEEAESARTQAQGMLTQYQARLDEARTEANRIIEEARKTAESMRRDVLAKAEEESRQIVARAQEEITAERDRAFEELRRQVGELSVELAERVVGHSLDKERHLQLVDGYIDELAGEGGRGAS
ncbi:MAG TPA: F0F1 ATP synthase subunit B [Actinomycetota bacterium]|nr:F0F1 ATP synthase subunit B [Actinomycetota bacterium]